MEDWRQKRSEQEKLTSLFWTVDFLCQPETEKALQIFEKRRIID
jgi:hypothetical protein